MAVMAECFRLGMGGLNSDKVEIGKTEKPASAGFSVFL
jgi:hypothetical protein